MVKKKGGSRRKTRYKLRKNYKERGKISISRFIAEFKEGDKVALVMEPAVQKGMFYPRFSGKIGIILSKRGRCYEVMVNDQGKKKNIMVHPVHLKRI